MLDAPFLGFGERALAFFDGLKKDNTKSYFEANREVFEADVKQPLARLFDEAAARYGGTVKIFRQNRDIRFSKDKSPYKTNTYGVVKDLDGGRMLYASISADGMYAATGEYQMSPDQLERFRAAIDDEDAGEQLGRALEHARGAGLEVWSNSLKSAPRGVARDHPRIELMRMKNVVVGAGLDPAATLDGRAPLEHCYAVWEAAEPVNAWLAAQVGPSTETPRGR